MKAVRGKLLLPIVVVILALPSKVFGQDVIGKTYYYNGGLQFSFIGSTFSITAGDSESPVTTYKSDFTPSMRGPYQFGHSKPFDFFIFSVEDFCVLYFTRNPKGPLRIPFVVSGKERKSERSSGYLDSVIVNKASSFLTEATKLGKVSYIPSGNPPVFNFSRTPWMVKDYGRGQWISFRIDRESLGLASNKLSNKINRLILSNGFFYPANPGLFWSNSRVKTGKLYHKDFTVDFSLRDTPNLQTIQLPEELDPNERQDFKIEIGDAFPGTDYKDTGISAIFYEAEIEK